MFPSPTVCGCLEVTGTRAPWEHRNRFVHWCIPSVSSILTCSSLSRSMCWMLTKWVKRGGIWTRAILNLKLFLPGRSQLLQSCNVSLRDWMWGLPQRDVLVQCLGSPSSFSFAPSYKLLYVKCHCHLGESSIKSNINDTECVRGQAKVRTISWRSS